MIIDTHAHLFWESFKEDFDKVIDRALEAGITHLINVGVDVETSKKALGQIKFLERSSQALIKAYSSIGIHPHEAVKYAKDLGKIDEDIKKLEEIYHQNPQKVIGVGECGLDFLFRSNDLHPDIILEPEQIKDLQKRLLKAQIDLAKKLNLPLLIHCRDDRSENPDNTECWDEVIKMTKEHFGIYHCYSGLAPTTSYLLQETKFYISFAGNLTYPKNEYLMEAAKKIPLERIVVETDCPFLPPQNYRGQRNEPSFITEVIKTIAQAKNLPVEEIKQAIFENTKRVFRSL